MGIDGVEAPVSIIEKSKSKASDTASKVADSATEGVKNAAASAAATILADTDGDGQEHNEL
jgi:FK506-binding protein 2